jgi:hypothetical protein
MPASIVVALVAHAIFIFMRFFLVINNFDLLSMQNIPILIVAVAVHVVGIIGLLLRKKWIRKYTLFLFGFYLLMQIPQIGKLLKEFDAFGVIWSVTAISLSLYIFHQFYIEPRVQSYLNK